ncbi:hypothetical protein VPH35_018147 [Triticum aestivum]|uniref:Uncharacterized protein n=1 Tax=Triticum aestivum TaxID=4565 RepID=A0A3B6APX3_WHEAT|nr:putative disease resistance protein RGA3 [Triticum aestivum]
MPASTLLVVGGWVFSPIIKELIGEARSLVSSKYSSFKHLTKHLRQLVDVLEEMTATVEAVQQQAELRRSDEDVSAGGGMASWVGRLVDAIHDVESVLDVFTYDDIVMSNLRDNKVAQVAHSAARAGRRLIGRDKAFNRLKKLLDELPLIQQSLRDLAQLPRNDSGGSRGRGYSRSVSRKATGPLLPGATGQELFVGYEREYGRLVSALLNDVSDQPSSSSSNKNVVAVIGHSGIGKTMIARRAWHDERINGNNNKKHFDLMVWASVGCMFTETELLAEIWRSIPGSSGVEEKCAAAGMSFGVLQQAISGLVGSRRCLLVLDDVCNDESGRDWTEKMRTTWEDVLAPFRDGGNGSRILVTCRATICAKVLGAGTKIPLNGLRADDLVLVLKKTAFGDAHKETPVLDGVIRSVAEQLRGSPSAAKTIVGMVRNKQRKKDWKKLLEKVGSWYAGEVPLAGAAYESSLRSCLKFCSMFPDKWEFEAETLVKMWIAHGIIRGDHGQSMEDVGREYVRALQARSMLKTISRDGRATCFAIHEQVSVCATGFLRLSNDDLVRRRGSIPASVRHLSLTGGGCLALAQLKDNPVLKKLRTLLIFDDGHSSSGTAVSAIDNHVLKQLKAVRVVDFAGTRITELPKGVGKLKHLRYLGLPDSVRSIPAAVTKLLHLQTLSLGKDCKLDGDHGFPGDGMSRLINLRHLDMDMKYVAMIRGIGRLEKLQGSVEFCADRGRGHGMEELAGIHSIHGTLTVKGLQAVANKEEAQKAQLGRKDFLKTLKLEWEPPKLGDRRTCSTSMDSHEQVLEGLQPNGRIEELQIQRYQGASSPSWLESNLLASLSHLNLVNCRNWRVLPCLSQLPDLRVLHIKEMYAIARIDHRLYGSGVLQSLEKLVLNDMPSLVEWSAESSDRAFPRLQEILILNCPRLAKLPRVPATVKKMRIEKDSSSYYLDMAFSPKSSSFTLDVHGEALQLLQQDLLHRDHALAVSALSISKYAGESEVNVKLLSSVRSLSLSRCVVTDRLLGVFFQNLQSLEKLQISDCGDFLEFPEDAMPPSLKSIEVNRCHPTLAQKLRGSARISSIPRVHIC